jgi:hypothetical protein
MKTPMIFLTLSAVISVATIAACSGSSNTARETAKKDAAPVSSLAGASADGTAAPSVPSATDALNAAAVTSSSKAATGGTDDMKKSLSKSAEETQMPMVGHGNNHSAPDKNAVEAAKAKP